MTQVIRSPDLARYVDDMEGRIAALERQLANSLAGGALVGNYPNPNLAPGAAATNLGPAGGALAGTYPNPTLVPRVGDFVAFVSTGPKPGNSLVYTTTTFVDTDTNRGLTYTTPAFNTRGKVTWQSRWDKVSNDWGWGGAGIKVNPAPVTDYGGIDAAGSAVAMRNIYPQYGPGGGGIYTRPGGSFFVDLAPSTTYTFMHTFAASVGSWQFDNSMLLCQIDLEVYVR